MTVLERYDPAGFSAADARKMAGVSCIDGAIGAYSEASVDGQQVFRATCARGNAFGLASGVNFEKTGPRAASFTAVFSQNGSIATQNGTLRL